MASVSKANPVAVSGDALDDEFELDDSLIAGEISDDGLDNDGGQSNKSRNGIQKARRMNGKKAVLHDEEDEFDDGSNDDAQGVDALPSSSKKRKVNHDDEQQKILSQMAEVAAADKKKRRKEKAKEAKRQKTLTIDIAEAQVDTSLIAQQPPLLQADFLAEMQAIAIPKLSAIEAEDLRIPESFLLDTSDISDRKSLKDFIQRSTGLSAEQLTISEASHSGSPTLLIICGAALRAADVVRELRALSGNNEVAKLFAKHFKLAEHCTYCRKTKFATAAGTPDRMHKLFDAEALSSSQLKFVVLDLMKDSKKRNLLDLPEARQALFRLLAVPSVRSRLVSGETRLVLY